MSTSNTARGPFVGSMMRQAHQWVREQIFTSVTAAGFDDLSPAQVAMFRYPTLDGQRPSPLAESLGITKQSLNDLLREMEERGYLVRVPDPSDGRGRVIRLTERGRQLEVVAYDAAEDAERAIAGLLGARRFRQLREALETVARHIAADDASRRAR